MSTAGAPGERHLPSPRIGKHMTTFATRTTLSHGPLADRREQSQSSRVVVGSRGEIGALRVGAGDRHGRRAAVLQDRASVELALRFVSRGMRVDVARLPGFRFAAEEGTNRLPIFRAPGLTART